MDWERFLDSVDAKLFAIEKVRFYIAMFIVGFLVGYFL